ncbi:hypothetical protein SAMN05192559_10387 [Halobacillus karajensis]|uniref:Sporulation protein (Bac_small_yrzI) n=1 Tax=Halobacillus karajensis TaxID=195088 RepID=A0A024P2E4_9BACI|nr:hypothetical protein [Halobacillus karajensis]CDQ19969.1 hypothetical protein BN982_02276 [Halobacillus karajensis]CDQ22429.1 hypothetical protein BN983_00637 [Halobacillus karajensis]CDQ28272.1 hypothetical protein BN981_02566 [Halobacillus karajensis]SEH68980.1 hypothetical protein SAMN05192559_10387 [Halobacillus karajensis]
MRINLIIFTIIIERMDNGAIEKSKQRSRYIERKINDSKNKYLYL